MLPANWLHACFTALLHFVGILLRQFVAFPVPGLYAEGALSHFTTSSWGAMRQTYNWSI